MNGDEHFEVVLGRDGSCRVYFSDATRTELPAATASEASSSRSRGRRRRRRSIALRIDDSGESWVGRGSPVADPGATARVAYTSRGKPYFIDVPFPRLTSNQKVSRTEAETGITRSNEAAGNNRHEFILRSSAALC